jgi:hypothetical protein
MILFCPVTLLTVCMAPRGDVVQDAAKDGAVALEVCLADLHPSQHQGQAPEGHHQAWAGLLVVLNREATAVAAITTAVAAATLDYQRNTNFVSFVAVIGSIKLIAFYSLLLKRCREN